MAALPIAKMANPVAVQVMVAANGDLGLVEKVDGPYRRVFEAVSKHSDAVQYRFFSEWQSSGKDARVYGCYVKVSDLCVV